MEIGQREIELRGGRIVLYTPPFVALFDGARKWWSWRPGGGDGGSAAGLA